MKKRFAYLVGVGLGVAVPLSSCQQDDDSAGALLNRRWRLTEVDGTDLRVSSYSLDYDSYLQFAGAGSELQGQASCHRLSGSFIVSDKQQLTITRLSPTRSSCAVQIFSGRYLTALPQITRYEIAGRTLRLYDASAPKPRLVFEAAP
ncbi:META domain-containing protein [uncultured Hymenobacter sp.]|uniref:META domain-containing protein n=1 Tax=uncultured Hymenobacter sp. TaxID=170016 RepID=UPI0035CBF834